MRNLISSLVLLAAVFCFNDVSAQLVVDKGKSFIDAGLGIAVYGIETTVEITGETDQDAAAGIRLPIGYEYSPVKRVTTGIQFAYSKYATDSANANQDSRSTDVLLKGSFHLLNQEKVSLYAGLLFGFGTLKIDDTNLFYNVSYKASGPAYGGNLGLRILPIENFFIDFKLGGLGYNLNGTAKDNFGNSLNIDMKAGGINLGLALGARF